MAQKDKVKELVGRGLGSYHTKSLQQIDRIEKKNKEQNHKINILTNELDNDYLTKTEEGSVVSLEHSKEGMVYLDELQGNTLVNYCPDGAKELTLNGDIDVAGTNVTLTEGVDNGLVDVVCEGNTLVNLAPKPSKVAGDGNINDRVIISDNVVELTLESGFYTGVNFTSDSRLLKPNTTYTLIANIIENTMTQGTFALMEANDNTIFNSVSPPLGYKGIYVATTITRSSYTLPRIQSMTNTTCKTGEKIKFSLMVLEGDFTNKPIPAEYFEGMKSVGECEDNKLEVVSRGKNLCTPFVKGGVSSINGVLEFTASALRKGVITSYISINNDKDHYLSGVDIYEQGDAWWFVAMYDINKKYIKRTGAKCESKLVSYKNNLNPQNEYLNNNIIPRTAKYLVIHLYVNTAISTITLTSDDILENYNEVQLEEGTQATKYTPYAENKKEITLSEPLRALPNGVKDKVVKIGGKWYVERNCIQIHLDGSLDWSYNGVTTGSNDEVTNYRYFLKGFNDLVKENSKFISDKYDKWGIRVNGNKNICFDSIPITVAKSNDVSEFKVEMNKLENQGELILELATPIYEPLEIDSTLNTYNDTTHISNNSTIPCNMTVKNTGYNAIIKPSTQYTVALDTNKNGTIGINLGGAKVTTTNNVATITTPVTLVDDTLRLTGKGIKASNIRLLEGDKTNWIPSHFEGMKSCFEDKLQDDGTYKMEILSNNKNLLDIDESIEFDVMTIYLDKPLEKGVYSISCEKSSGYKEGIEIALAFHNNLNNVTSFYLNRTSTFNLSRKVDKIHLYSNGHDYVGSKGKFVTIDKLQIERGTDVTNYEKRKQNKIQFSSIEPLRGVGDVKDRFVFKDGKLMIERNCGEIVLNGSEGDKTTMAGGRWYKSGATGMTSVFVLYDTPKKIGYNTSICERFTNTYNSNPFTSDKTKSFTYTDHPTLTTMYFNYGDNPNVTVKEFCEWLSKNPTIVVCQLAEPTYEEITPELQKLILKCYDNATLHFNTNIPPKSLISYTANTSNIYRYLDTLKLSKEECDSIINSMERV